jgi:hypothetical protein
MSSSDDDAFIVLHFSKSPHNGVTQEARLPKRVFRSRRVAIGKIAILESECSIGSISTSLNNQLVTNGIRNRVLTSILCPE